MKQKVREDQMRMRVELQKQMEQHKQAKVEEKKGDLEYYEYIRNKKEEQEREQREKKDNIRRMIEEQKIVRDKQIEDHNRAKYVAEKEKRKEAERLKGIY